MTDNSNQFLDALKEMQGVEVGNIVNVEVLSVEDGQIAVGVENAGVEGVITKREFTNDRNADLKQLVKFLKSAYPGCKIVMFCNPLTAAGYVRSHPVDVLFTEIAMTGMSGFRLKEITEKCNPGALTIFISATAAYAMDALNCRVFDYMVKPVTPEKTRNALKETKFQPFIQKN